MLRAIVLWYAAMSVLTFGVYLRDKAAARNGRWRTREGVLHLLALAGGWPGAVLGQRFIHHKSRKGTFLLISALTVLLNATVLGLVLYLAWTTGLLMLL